jgi:hypothetical protein
MAIKKLDKTIVANAVDRQKFDVMYGGLYNGALDSFHIEWDNEPDNEGYNVYYSLFPMMRYKANKELIMTNSYDFYLPIFPQNLIFYFWVSKIVDNKEIFINEDGQTVYTIQEKLFYENTESPIEPNDAFPEINQENIESTMKDVLTRIKNDFKFMLQNDGIKCDVYMRRWGSDAPLGVPCKCTDTSDADADFRGRGRCSLCFGTGIIGGYYPPIKMIIRFNETVAKKFNGSVYGLKVAQTYDAWTLPQPILRTGDLIVRSFDGVRYEVTNVTVSSVIRGIPTRQDIEVDIVQETDIRKIVSLDTINKALEKINDPRFNEFNRISF